MMMPVSDSVTRVGERRTRLDKIDSIRKGSSEPICDMLELSFPAIWSERETPGSFRLIIRTKVLCSPRFES